MTEIYCVQNLIKDYEGRRVLDIPTLDIHQGEVFALIGPSGAGKSTLLRLLNFLEQPTGGSIAFFEETFEPGIAMPLGMRRRVTTVFQRPMLLETTVWENVAYGLRLRGRRNDHSLIEAALEQVGLAKLAKQRARTLSGGEAQRVALARAMVIHPDVLLLDEPTANLDPYNVGLIEKIIQDLNQNQGVTLVLVTHNVFQARRLAHRVAFMLEGHLVETGTVDQIFNSPLDSRTTAFVRGDMVY